jgi:hypothetical protein
MSLLRQGNLAFRNKDYQNAIKLYREALKTSSRLSSMIQFNIEMAEKRDLEIVKLPVLNPIKKLPISVLVITWDVGHNPLGRSYMLAEAMTHSVRNVVLAGFQFPRYGDDIWGPVKDGALPVISLAGKNFPDILDDFDRIVQKYRPDIVIACKPRLPSVQLGITFKKRYNIPLIIDVDDHELSFFKEQSPLTLKQLKSLDMDKLRNEIEPYAEPWTRLTEHLTKSYADEIIVSNVALEREFGGTLIPHVRDEKTFDTSLYNKKLQRKKYNVPESAKIVMFFGTPRVHKGVGDLASAIGKIQDKNCMLVVVGTAPDKSVTAQLNNLSEGKVIYLPNQPFSAIPEIIVMADLVCLPQDEGHAISKYQLPAKAIDAIGMGIPLLVSNTEPLMQLVNDGVAKLIESKDLSVVIETALHSKPSSTETLMLRKRFLEGYSYHFAATKLKTLIEKTLKNKMLPLTGFDEIVDFQGQIFSHLRSQSSLKLAPKPVDIVVFWKQNDTGLYGRRSDMVIKYLASRDDVRKVIVFDAPLSEHDLENMKVGHALTQSRQIYIKTYEKLLGKLDTRKTSYNVFSHKPGIYTHNKNDRSGRQDIITGYTKYLNQILTLEDVNASESIFWFYPKNYLANELIDFYKPKKVVVDVVDDHRAWPNVSPEEKARLTLHYKNILGGADLALANCQPVIDSMKQYKSDIKLIPNGCEENPEIIEPKNHIKYEELKCFAGKVIGFVGNLEAKIDIDLIQRIADEFKDALIVLVGSTHAYPKVRELQSYQNIRMFGVVPYENVSSIVSKFNVGIVPHKKMDMTKNMNPLKVFVYASNNIPVVSTKINNIETDEMILMSENNEEFLVNIRKALNMGDFNFNEFVQKNSWKSRLDEVFQTLIG